MILGQLKAQIITDRPDQTESSSTVKRGDLQIESGLLIGFEHDDDNSTKRQLLAPTNLLRYGITKGFEIRFLSQFETFKNNEVSKQGISDLQIGTKIQLLQNENKNTEIAFLSHLIISTDTDELSSDRYHQQTIHFSQYQQRFGHCLQCKLPLKPNCLKVEY